MTPQQLRLPLHTLSEPTIMANVNSARTNLMLPCLKATPKQRKAVEALGAQLTLDCTGAKRPKKVPRARAKAARLSKLLISAGFHASLMKSIDEPMPGPFREALLAAVARRSEREV